MLKLSRILRSLALLFRNHRYGAREKRSLAWTFLILEWKMLWTKKSNNREIRFRILHYQVTAFSLASLHILFREIFLKEEYASDLTHQTPFIIDCGANIGMATLYFKLRYPDASIECYEPDPSTFRLLERNIQQNKLSGVTLYNQAISDQHGTIAFYVEQEVPGSLRMSTIEDRVSDQRIRHEVPCIRLSDKLISRSADILKMDVEGAELAILDDLSKTDAIRSIRELFIEYHHNIENQRPAFGTFLEKLESGKFDYSISTEFTVRPGEFQDFLIHAIRH